MASLAELKRRLTVGTIIEAMPGHPFAASVGIPRTIRSVKTVGIGADNPRDGNGVSWIYWPKSSLVTYDASASTFTTDGMPYRIHDEMPISDETVNAMRDWLSDCEWADENDFADMPAVTVMFGVARYYMGGIAQFVADGA